jgi:replicative DNA helicase
MSDHDLLRRVPPQSIEAEQSVLGAVFFPVRLDNDNLVPEQAKILAEITAVLRPDDFYRERHRDVFRAMLDLAGRKHPIDAVTMTDALRARGTLEAIGGPGYLAELGVSVPTAANVGFYARRVREMSVLRALASTATEIAAMAFEAPVDVRDFLASTEARLTAVTRLELGDPEPRLAEVVRDVLLEVTRGELAGVPTGFPDLDQFLTSGGFSRGSLNVLAATTSAGKSALASNIAVRVQRGGTLVLSSEMTRKEIVRRVLADLGLIDWALIARRRPPRPDDEELARMRTAAERLLAMPLEVHYRRRLTPADVRREGRLSLPDFDGKLDLIIVDYLQLMDSDTPQRRRDLEIASITKELKNIAGELNVPILLLSQLNREAVKTESGEPELWHLRESGAIEQDSDTVIMLWEQRDQNPHPFGDIKINWKIDKQRNGPKVRRLPALLFKREYTQFVQEPWSSD